MKPSLQRSFLRGTGTLLALPTLESISYRRVRAAENQSTPKTTKTHGLAGNGLGVTQETWFPNVEQTGTDYDLPLGLKPLSRHKDDIAVVQVLEPIQQRGTLGQYILVDRCQPFFRSRSKYVQ